MTKQTTVSGLLRQQQTRMTAAQYRAYLLQEQKKKPPKHRNQKVYVFKDGFTSIEKDDVIRHGDIVDVFDSIKEFNRWNELRILEKAGKISDLKKQVPFEIHEAFTDEQGKKHRAAIYNADFTYTENGCEIVEDVKGQDKNTGAYLTTPVFNLKWKLLQAKYQDKRFKLY